MTLLIIALIALFFFFLLIKHAPRLPIHGVFAGLEKIIC